MVPAVAINTNFIWAEQPWPTNTFQNLNTQFTIGYQPIFGDPSGGGLNAVALQAMIEAWYSATEARDGGSQSGGLGAAPGDSQNPFELNTQLNYTTLLTYLHHEEVRNLYYFGHGAPDFIGQKKTNPPKYLTIADLNVGLGNFPRYPQYHDHPFRFVFLDGCNTAKGDLCNAFGIPKQKNMPNTAFVNKGLRYRAFVGWKTYLIAGWAGAPNNAHLNFMANLLGTWPQINQATGEPYTLRGAIDTAATGAAYRITTDKDLVIYGYEGLWFDDTIP